MDKVQKTPENEQNGISEKELMDRRGFLRGLGKWSLAVIGCALLGDALVGAEREANAAGAWANRVGGGGAWANRAGGGGAWANAVGGGGAWVNRGAAWANRGTAWINRF